MDYNKNHEGYHYKSHRSHSSDILLVKIMTIRHLNRALHLDNVTIKLCNWKQWEKARPKLTANYDFFEGDPESDEEIDRASKGDEEPEEEEADPEPDTDKDAEDDEEEGEAEKGEYEYYDEEKPEEDEYYGADYYDEEKPEEAEFKADGAEGGWEYYGEEGEENKEDVEEKKEGEEGEGDY